MLRWNSELHLVWKRIVGLLWPDCSFYSPPNDINSKRFPPLSLKPFLWITTSESMPFECLYALHLLERTTYVQIVNEGSRSNCRRQRIYSPRRTKTERRLQRRSKNHPTKKKTRTQIQNKGQRSTTKKIKCQSATNVKSTNPVQRSLRN